MEPAEHAKAGGVGELPALASRAPAAASAPCPLCVQRTGTPGPPETFDHLLTGCPEVGRPWCMSAEGDRTGTEWDILSVRGCDAAKDIGTRCKFLARLKERLQEAHYGPGLWSYATWALEDRRLDDAVKEALQHAQGATPG